MRLRSFLMLTIFLFFTPFSLVNAGTVRFENIEELRAKIQRYAENYYLQEYGKEKFSRDVRLRISQLDTRLKLVQCEKAIRFELIRPAHQSRNITVKTLCDSRKRWSIYVPITLEVYADIVVAARDLGRGTIISDEDLDTIRIDTSSLPTGHIVDKSRVLGMELKRSTRSGGYLLLSSMEKPRVINKGDVVLVESRNSTLSVATKGTALNNGQVGEQIKVRNDQSDRVVDALVAGPGRVVVVSR